MNKILIIGASDAGISAALRIKEIEAKSDVTVIAADTFPNFRICGLPFYLSGEVRDWRDLAHRTRDEIEQQGIGLLLDHRAVKIDPEARQVHVRSTDGQTRRIGYDKLLIATGAESVQPPIRGIDTVGVFFMRWMADSFAVKRFIEQQNPRRAVIIGGGYIGLEMADALTHKGLKVVLMESAPQVLTKWIGGHGTGIGGIVIDGANFDWTDPKFTLFNTPDPSNFNMRFATDLGENSPVAFVMRMRMVALRNLGACISPDNAWIFLQGMETLPLRMQRHCENAMAVARHLKQHPDVSWVRYPGLEDDPSYATAANYLKKGFCAMVVFGIKGGRDAGHGFIDRLEVFSHLANVGDAKSLALHPASTTHSQLTADQQVAAGVRPDMVRLSIGIEHVDDIIADLDRALKE